MKKIKIVCVGKLSNPFCRDGCAEYVKRLKSSYDITLCEIPEQPTIKKECDEILKRAGEVFVLMDINGDQPDSVEFADVLRKEHERRDEIVFVIGGAEGVDERVREKAKKRISFGRVTYTHQLARLLLYEQLYRASTIIKGVPYHK
ncbi:MAG: 23S rRNA (pseudouridine(1915)-N(3))-methyltransferase RlmH [Clostridiales bacterium]|nr:23S rRNA (pseudouridine(1915)-N(3))-methyltransferase RlmH [Clostridiales bacterium]